jgi:putative ABC transport system permease protein
MLKINLRLAMRNILRNKLYTAINIIGLSVASAFCILVYMYVKNEQSFDDFHHDGAHLFRVEVSDVFAPFRKDNSKARSGFFSFLTKNVDQKNMIDVPAVMGPDLKRNFPEIEGIVRMRSIYRPIIRKNNQSFEESASCATYADPDFFKVMDFPLIQGDKNSVLSDKKSVVISQRFAKKYFGNINPVGQTLNLTSENLLLSVTGVAKDFPNSSSFNFDIVIPREADEYYAEDMKGGVNQFNDLTILRLNRNANVANFQNKLLIFSKKYFKLVTDDMTKQDPQKKQAVVNIFIRPFAEAHYSPIGGWTHYTDLKNIYQLVCLSVVILLIACLNYVLLTLTSAISRSQDIGVRKTIGADRKQIILQYYTETQLLAFVSVIIGFLISVSCMPFFSSLTGTSLSLASFSFINMVFMLLGLAMLLGLLAGVYPASAMSGLNPLNIMRGFSTCRINPVLSKGLVVLQYTICIVLVISALVINRQMHFLNNADMGFDKEQVVEVQNPYSWNDAVAQRSFKGRLTHYVESQPELQDMTSTNYHFGGFNSMGFLIGGKQMFVQEMNVDFNYFNFNKIPILLGRNFSKDIASDSSNLKLTNSQRNPNSSSANHAIVVNQTLYKMLGKPELNVVNYNMGGIIIGICKDYHTEDLTKPIMPEYHKISGDPAGCFWIKIRQGESIPTVMENLHSNWNKITDNMPFSYTFMDEDVAKSYDAYLRWMKTITTSCILAIIIACLGLFGLSGLTTINRTKEIGIRKVLGASVYNLFLLLNRGTLLLATGSFLIAAPIAFYFVNQWLDNFAYRITPDWTLFTIAGLIAICTAILAVSYHTVKAALTNPVKSLRSE